MNLVNMKKSNNIISDWLEKYGNPEIDFQVEKEIEYINKMKPKQLSINIDKAADELREMKTITDDSIINICEKYGIKESYLRLVFELNENTRQENGAYSFYYWANKKKKQGS